MKKVLFVATVLKKHINVFHLPYLKWFQDNGYETHVCARNDYEKFEKLELTYCDRFYDLPFERSPFNRGNLCVYAELKKIIQENDYDIIHCHTPIGGALTRLAARKARNNGTKVIYTAHGFHFFKGAPIKNWLMYFPLEKMLSKYTDCLLTINEEDYKISSKKFKADNSIMVKGVGIDTQKFMPITTNERENLRIDYGFSKDDFILIYVGELSFRKHQDLLIKTVHILKDKIKNIKLLLVGNGELTNEYKSVAKKLKVEKHVEFLGFRKDVNKLMSIADIAVSSSRQEGLPVNIMEAMGVGLPIVATDCRGNRDLISDGKNGFLVSDNNKDFAEKIETLYLDEILKNNMAKESVELIKPYTLKYIVKDMSIIYGSLVTSNKMIKDLY
jgi:glycosyltransferase EpsD